MNRYVFEATGPPCLWIWTNETEQGGEIEKSKFWKYYTRLTREINRGEICTKCCKEYNQNAKQTCQKYLEKSNLLSKISSNQNSLTLSEDISFSMKKVNRTFGWQITLENKLIS